MADKSVDVLLKIRSDINGLVEARNETKRLNNQMMTLRRSITQGVGLGLGFLGVQSFTGALKDSVGAGLEFNRTIEQQTVAFETLLGSQELAQGRLRELTDFAASTPFELNEVVEANRLLQTLTGGMLANSEGMSLAGDAAAASGRGFAEVAFWVGRLYSGLQDGVPIGEATMRLTEMGLISGDTRLELQRLSREGAQGVSRSMEIMRDTFGSTIGAMEKQSQTFNGMLSTVKDQLTVISAQLGQPLFKELKEVLQELGQLIGALPTESEKAFNAIDSQTSALKSQVSLMASIEEMNKAKADLIAAQEDAQRRLNQLLEKEQKLNAIRGEKGITLEGEKLIDERLDINSKEIEAYKLQVRAVQAELLKFGAEPINGTVESIESRINQVKDVIQILNQEIQDSARVGTENGLPNFREIAERERGAQADLDGSAIARKQRLEDELKILEIQRELVKAQKEFNETGRKSAEQIVKENAEKQKQLALEEARKSALRDAQSWMEKNAEKAKEKIRLFDLENMSLAEQLVILENQFKKESEIFEKRIANAEQSEVKDQLAIQRDSELIDLKKQILTLEGKITDEKDQQLARANQEKRKALNDFANKQDLAFQNHVAKLQVQRARLQADFSRTSFEKRNDELGLLKLESDALRDNIRNLEIKNALERDETTAQRIDEKRRELSTLEEERILKFDGPDPSSFSDQFTDQFTQLREQWGTVQQQIAEGFAGAIDQSISSASSKLTEALLITGQWRDALLEIPRVIATQIVQSLIQMGLRYVATRLMMAFVDKSASMATAGAVGGQAGTIAAAWGPAAALATIATLGKAAFAAPFQVAGAVAASTAIGTAANLGAGAIGFREGGYTGSGRNDEVAGLVHKNEVVFDAQATKRIGVEPLLALKEGRTNLPEMDASRMPNFSIPRFNINPAQTKTENVINVPEPEVKVVAVNSFNGLDSEILENPSVQDAIHQIMSERGLN